MRRIPGFPLALLLGAIMATGTRIMYRNNDARGNPIAVTGTYFEPSADWPRRGPRGPEMRAPAPAGRCGRIGAAPDGPSVFAYSPSALQGGGTHRLRSPQAAVERTRGM